MNRSPVILTAGALRAIEAAGAGDQLMEAAGATAAALAETIRAARGHPVLIVAGPGNNGGDALVVARHLHERNHHCHLVMTGDEKKLPFDAHQAWKKILATGIAVHRDIPPVQQWDLVIDGLFGIGLNRPIGDIYAAQIHAMQAAAKSSACPLLSLDCPSGLNTDTGTRQSNAVTATHTITFLGLKPGLLTGDGPDSCGQITVDDLAMTPPDLPPRMTGLCIGPADFQSVLTPRQLNSHKGNFGAAGILGGGTGMVGAALLAARASLKLGAGRVYLGFPGTPPLPVDPVQPELMLSDGETLLTTPLTALACGPGLGQSKEARHLLGRAVEKPIPLVLDADALNLLSASSPLRAGVQQRTSTTVLTPHPGEAARLLETDIATIQRDRIGAASRLATLFRSWIILKGCGSVVMSPNGEWWINTTGNAGLASAGSGDVLTGFLVALLAGNTNAQAAILAAPYLHGAAADALGAKSSPHLIAGTVGLTASELPDAARTLLNQWINDSASK